MNTNIAPEEETGSTLEEKPSYIHKDDPVGRTEQGPTEGQKRGQSVCTLEERKIVSPILGQDVKS